MGDEAVAQTSDEEIKKTNMIDLAACGDFGEKESHPLFLELRRQGYPEDMAYQAVANLERQKVELLQERMAFWGAAVCTFVVCWTATSFLPDGSTGDGIAKILSKILGFVVAGIANSMDQPQIARGAFWGNVVYLVTWVLFFLSRG